MPTFLPSFEEMTQPGKSKKFDLDVLLCVIFALTLPITNFSISISQIRFEPQRLVIILCILRLIIQLSRHPVKEAKRRKLAWLLLFPVLLTIVYAFFLTALQPEFIKSIRSTTDTEVYNFILKRAYKYLSYIALSVYLGLVLRNERKIHTVVCALAVALCVAEILGIVQSLVFLISRVDLFPMHRGLLAEDNITYFTESVTVNFLGLSFLRINSLAHEPKALGVFIAFLFFIKLYWSRYKQKSYLKAVPFLDNYMSKTLLISVIVILLTFSSSGLISLSGGIVIMILMPKIKSFRKTFYFNANSLIYLILAIVTALLLFIFIDNFSDNISSFLQASLLRRISQFTANFSIESFYASFDPEDGAVLYNILNYPNVMISGLGFGAYSNISLNYFSKYYSKGLSPFSRNILVETIFSVGIPGLILLLWFFYKINVKGSWDKYNSSAISLQVLLNQLVLMNFLIRSNEPVFFTVLGILSALYLNRFCI